MILKAFILILFSSILGHSQVDDTFNIPAQLEPIDLISLESGFIQLVATDGLYELQKGEFVLLKKFKDQHLTRPLQNYSQLNAQYFYPTAEGQMFLIEKSNKQSVPLNLKSEGVLQQFQKKYYLAENNLFQYQTNEWNKTSIENEAPFVDACIFNNNLCLANYGGGIYIIDQDGNLEENFNGEPENLITAIHADKYNLFAADKQSLIIYDRDYQKEKIDLSPHLNEGSIIEIERSNSGLWLATGSQLLNIRDQEIKETKLTLNDFEEIISIHCDQQLTWVLTNQRLFFISGLNIQNYNIDSGTHDLCVYQIRNKLYSSNGNSIYRFNDQKNAWEKDTAKKAIHNAINHFDQEAVSLIYPLSIEKLNAQSAKKIKSISIDNYSPILNIVNDKYICTEDALMINNHGTISRADEFKDTAYNILTSNSKEYILAKNGIYNSNFETLIKHSFIETVHQTQHNSYLLTIDSQQLLLYNTYSNELEKLNLGPVKLNDFLCLENEIVFLTQKSLLFIDKKKAFDSKTMFTRVIPLFDICENSKIENYLDGQLWLSCNSNLKAININEGQEYPYPKLAIHKKSKSSIEYKTNNHWAENIKYSYLNQSEKENKSIWSSDNKLELKDVSGSSTINSKMSDDVFGFPIYAPKIEFEGFEKSKINSSLIIMILFFLLTCLLLWRFFD